MATNFQAIALTDATDVELQIAARSQGYDEVRTIRDLLELDDLTPKERIGFISRVQRDGFKTITVDMNARPKNAYAMVDFGNCVFNR